MKRIKFFYNMRNQVFIRLSSGEGRHFKITVLEWIKDYIKKMKIRMYNESVIKI